jgi:hypothetical protein
MYDLFALPYGDRCNSTLIAPLVFFAAKSSSLRATLFGASKMRRGSLFLGVCLVNVTKLTHCLARPSSLLSYVRQFSPVDCQPLLPLCVKLLLTYTHSSFAFSVVCGACVVLFVCIVLLCVGLIVYRRVFGVVCILVCLFILIVLGYMVFVAFPCAIFAVSLAMTMSICRRMISCSLSRSFSSGSYRVSGAIFAGSLPFLVYFVAAGCATCFFVLGPGSSMILAVWSSFGAVSGEFLMVAISTWRSMTACTSLVGLMVSGSRSAIFFIL